MWGCLGGTLPAVPQGKNARLFCHALLDEKKHQRSNPGVEIVGAILGTFRPVDFP
jgi:hypothetical protein